MIQLHLRRLRTVSVQASNTEHGDIDETGGLSVSRVFGTLLCCLHCLHLFNLAS